MCLYIRGVWVGKKFGNLEDMHFLGDPSSKSLVPAVNGKLMRAHKHTIKTLVG